jgi:hypothetical protein
MLVRKYQKMAEYLMKKGSNLVSSEDKNPSEEDS